VIKAKDFQKLLQKEIKDEANRQRKEPQDKSFVQM
jgi:hypothetical protein